MKTSFYIATALLISLAILSSCERVSGVKGEIVKNCTGSYLKIEDTNLRICNSKLVADLPDGSLVKASYKEPKICKADEEIVCMMYYEYDADIEITKVELR